MTNVVFLPSFRATNIGFLTPSVTTYKGLNPSYRLYTVDGFEEGSSLVLDPYQSYSVFQGFSKAKFANGGSILSSSQFSILPQLAQKLKLASKVVKIDSKIIILLPKI